jgi:ParB-like chromosome segregation protein Spo0J
MSKAKLQKMEIVWLDPHELKPWKNNAKEHPPEQVDAIALQIDTYGWDQPAVITPGKVILKGHGRQLGAIKLGCKIPCVIKHDLTEADQVAIRIADNKVAESRWDADRLREDFAFLQAVNYDMQLTAFADSAVSLVMTDWESDIKTVEKVRPNLDGIESVIKVRCPQAMKEDVVKVVTEAIHNAGLPGVTVE